MCTGLESLIPAIFLGRSASHSANRAESRANQQREEDKAAGIAAAEDVEKRRAADENLATRKSAVERARLRAKKGRRSTILTSTRGVEESSNKTLLGQ